MMDNSKKKDIINDTLDVKFSWVDLFYSFCDNKGIDDPESDLTDEEWDAMEKEFLEIVTYDMLRNLSEAIMIDGMERINNINWEKEENICR